MVCWLLRLRYRVRMTRRRARACVRPRFTWNGATSHSGRRTGAWARRTVRAPCGRRRCPTPSITWCTRPVSRGTVARGARYLARRAYTRYVERGGWQAVRGTWCVAGSTWHAVGGRVRGTRYVARGRREGARTDALRAQTEDLGGARSREVELRDEREIELGDGADRGAAQPDPRLPVSRGTGRLSANVTEHHRPCRTVPCGRSRCRPRPARWSTCPVSRGTRPRPRMPRRDTACSRRSLGSLDACTAPMPKQRPMPTGAAPQSHSAPHAPRAARASPLP
jgi:hypothetical protein